MKSTQKFKYWQKTQISSTEERQLLSLKLYAFVKLNVKKIFSDRTFRIKKKISDIWQYYCGNSCEFRHKNFMSSKKATLKNICSKVPKYRFT